LTVTLSNAWLQYFYALKSQLIPNFTSHLMLSTKVGEV